MCQGILECEVLVGTRSAEGIMASGHVNRIKRPDTWLHRPMLQNVKKVLANPEPSTHGTKRTYRDVRLESVMRSKADVTYGNRSPPRLAATFRRIDNNTFANDAARDQLEFKLVISRQRLAGLRRQ